MKTARYRTVVREVEHAERVMEKKRRVEVLRALLEMHQQQHEHDEYIKGLRQRLKREQTQLENMRPLMRTGKFLGISRSTLIRYLRDMPQNRAPLV